jgi:hypothetical protein
MNDDKKAPWGAQPSTDKEVEKDGCEGNKEEEERTGMPEGSEEGEEEPLKIGAENVWLKMPTSTGEMIEINLLQVINQLFMDLGEFDARILVIEEALVNDPKEDDLIIKV